MDSNSSADQQDEPRPSLVLKLEKPLRRRNGACKACQILKHRCEFDDQDLSTSCRRCARRKIECVMPIPAPKRRKLSHSANPTDSSRKSLDQSMGPPQLQNRDRPGSQSSVDSDPEIPVRHGSVQNSGSQQLSPATTSEQPLATMSDHPAQASSETATNFVPTARSSNDPPPGMMLFSISQIQQVLDVCDRRKQRVQYLQAQVDNLEQSLKEKPTQAASQDSPGLTRSNAANDQQHSLIAALGGALVRQAKITDLNELYNLLEDLGVEQSHYWALHGNKEFRKSFPASHGNGRAEQRSNSVEAEQVKDIWPLQKVRDAVSSASAYNARARASIPPSQYLEPTLTRPKGASDKHITMLAAHASINPASKALMMDVVPAKASAEQTKQFQGHVDEISQRVATDKDLRHT